MKVYITSANAKKIEQNINPDKARTLYLDEIYHLSLWMFSIKEREWLAAAKTFYQNPEFYIQRFYEKIDAGSNKETEFVWVGSNSPAYHRKSSCKYLHSDFKNYLIPPEISQRGEGEKNRFRSWFEENAKSFDLDDPSRIQALCARIKLQFNLANPPNMQAFEKRNSGVDEFDNISIQELEKTIDEKIKEMNSLATTKRKIIGEYGRRCHLVLKKELKIENASDDAFLREWCQQKKDLHQTLKTYFKIRFNPDLEFKAELLDAIGFHECRECA